MIWGGGGLGIGGIVQQRLVLKSESASQNMLLLDQKHFTTKMYVDREKFECPDFGTRQWISGLLKKRMNSRKLSDLVLKEKYAKRNLT